MNTDEYEILDFRFCKLYSYCSLYDKSGAKNLLWIKNLKTTDVFILDIACYLLYLTSSSRKLLNDLFLFRDAVDCNRFVLDKIIEIVSENSASVGNYFDQPLIVQVLSEEDVPGHEEYIPLFLDFFHLLGNAVIQNKVL